MIQLTVTIQAHYIDRDDCPSEHVHSAETVIVQIPYLDPKFVVFPKLLDGLTGRAISRLGDAAHDYRHSLANPTLFDVAPDDAPWPDPARLEEDGILTAHCMDLLDSDTHARCYTAGLIIGKSRDDEYGVEYTWYRLDADPDNDDDFGATFPNFDDFGATFPNFYEAAGDALRRLDELDSFALEAQAEQSAEETVREGKELDWRRVTYRTDDLQALADAGFVIETRYNGFRDYFRWSHTLPDRIDQSPPFTDIEDAITDARRYLPQEEPA